MIHIKRSEKTKQFRVVYAGKNGEVLAVSESLKSKQSAWKNITAIYPDRSVFVQDDSVIAPVVYYVFRNNRDISATDPVKCNYKF